MHRLQTLTTPHLSDALAKFGMAARFAPSGVRPLQSGMRCSGRAIPVRHAGGVDVFLDALNRSCAGEVIVIDDGGREDQACLGDLMALEMKMAGVAGVVLWGRHRDADELIGIGMPLFSLGVLPNGPRHEALRAPDALSAARIGDCRVTSDDVVIADGNGVMFVSSDALPKVIAAAEAVRDYEQKLIAGMRGGVSFRDQVAFDQFAARRESSPDLSFRAHLQAVRARGGS